MTSCLSPPSSPSPSTNRQHKIQRKPLAPGFTLQIPTSPSPSTSSSLLHHHYHLGPESPRLLSSPEPQSSPCTSDFLTSSGSDDDDEDDEEERFRRGMPSRHSSLRVGGLNPSINFARPFPSYTTKKVALNSDLDEKEHLEERCARMSLITDPGVVKHIFGRSIQRTKRFTASFDLAAAALDVSPSSPPSELPPPTNLSSSLLSSNLLTLNPSIRSELSSSSSSSSTSRASARSQRLAARRAVFKDEFAELAQEDAARPSYSPKSLRKSEKSVTVPSGLGLFEESSEHGGRRRVIDFGGVSELGILAAMTKEDLEDSIVVFRSSSDSEDEDEDIVDRALNALKRKTNAIHSPFASRTSTPLIISTPTFTISNSTPSRPTSVQSACGPPLTLLTPASALALFAAIPPAPPAGADLQPSPSHSSSIRSITSISNSSTTSHDALAPAYLTRTHHRRAHAPIGLRELRELRSAALVLEQEAKRPVKPQTHPREMEKKLRRKPVPLPVGEGEEVLIATRSKMSASSPLVVTDESNGFVSSPDATVSMPIAPTLELPFPRSPRPPRSAARPVSMAGVPTPSQLRHTFSSSNAILTTLSLPSATTTTSESSSLFRRSTGSSPSPCPSNPSPRPTSSLVARSLKRASLDKMATHPTSTLIATRQRRRSSASSFESCSAPPTPLEASFFPECPSPMGDMPRTNSLLFETVLNGNAPSVPGGNEEQEKVGLGLGLALGNGGGGRIRGWRSRKAVDA